MLAILSSSHSRQVVHIPVISFSPCFSISFSIALFNACALAFSTFLAFFELNAAPGPDVGYKTDEVAVPRAFLRMPAEARCFCTFWRCALRRDLFGTLQLATEGIVLGGLVLRGIFFWEVIVRLSRGLSRYLIEALRNILDSRPDKWASGPVNEGHSRRWLDLPQGARCATVDWSSSFAALELWIQGGHCWDYSKHTNILLIHNDTLRHFDTAVLYPLSQLDTVIK